MSQQSFDNKYDRLSFREETMTHLNRRKALTLMGGTIAAAGLSAPAYAQNKTVPQASSRKSAITLPTRV